MKQLSNIQLQLFVLLLLLYPFQSIFAEERIYNNIDDVKVTIQVYDGRFLYPAPIWLESGITEKQVFEQVKIYRNANGPQFLLEHIPANESFDSWSRLYGIFGLYTGSSNYSLSDFVNDHSMLFRKQCKNFDIQMLKNNKNRKMALYLCEEIKNTQKGEVGIFNFLKVKDTIAVFYQEWEGKSFTIKDKSTWPVSQKEFNEQKRRFNKSLKVLK